MLIKKKLPIKLQPVRRLYQDKSLAVILFGSYDRTNFNNHSDY
jgi:predicted nucleotidyltransferase